MPKARSFDAVVHPIEEIGWNVYQTQVYIVMRAGGDVAGDIVLYENDAPLRSSNAGLGAFFEIIGYGAFRFDPVVDASANTRLLTFSTPDGSDPRTNGRRYTAVIW